MNASCRSALFFCCAAVGICLAAARANAEIIDSYTNTADNDPDSASVIGVGNDSENYIISPTVTDPIESRRFLTAQQSSADESTSLVIGGGLATITSSPGGSSAWQIIYGVGTFMDFDATGGGTNNAFLLTFDSVSSGMEYTIGANSAGGGGVSNGVYASIGTNHLVVPFSSFSGSPDFTDLIQISIQLRDGGLTHGGNMQLTQFETVPEPASLALLAVAVLPVAGLVARRRKSA